MKNNWKKLIAAFCATSMLMTLPGMSLYAAEPTHEDVHEILEAAADEVDMVEDTLAEDSACDVADIASESVESSGDAAKTEISEDPAEIPDPVDADVLNREEQENAAETVDQQEEYNMPADDTPVEEIIGATYTVGNGVYALYDPDTGSINLLSTNGGTLWNDWLVRAGIDSSSIKSITVARKLGQNILPKVKLPANSRGIFEGLENLTTLKLERFDTSNVTDMSEMFYECKSLETLDLSGFDTSNVTTMEAMFVLCESLKTLDLSKFKTSKVTNMSGMFALCHGLETLNLNGFDTSKVTTMAGMFSECTNLKTLNLNSFRTPSLTSTSEMFHTCLSLTSLSLSNFNTSKVTDMTQMFAGCNNLATLDLRGFQTTNVTSMSDMFTACKKIKYLDLGSFDMSKVTYASGMFALCDALDILVTPKNRKNTECYLPHTMYDRNGKKYSQLPVNTGCKVLGRTKELAASIFIDVRDPSHAYYNAIYWAVEKGITKGYSDGTFGIDRACTRGEMVMFLWRYAGKPEPKTVSKSPFKDVPTSHTFYKAILWAYQKGITKGYSDGTFGVNRNVSRGESMMFLWRLKGKQEPTPVSVSPFTDVPKTHTFYKAILWGYQKKITTGYTSGPKKGTFGINENCTRGQIVTFLYRAK